VKLADKICNLRDLASNPPLGWSLKRRVEYFDWARAVELPQVSATLLDKFDAAYAARPRRQGNVRDMVVAWPSKYLTPRWEKT
jgi:hypothetical protein